MKPKLVIVVGPTAVGKSAAALALAARIDAEIINADSQQVYRGMNIGTDKPSEAERNRVRHHLIDIVEPNEEFNAAIFRRLALERIENIRQRDKNVIVCGGTGLYLKALTGGLFAGPERNPELRQELERQIQERGLGSLYQRLSQADPEASSRIHPNDRQRIIRALEVYQLTGQPISRWQRDHDFRERSFDAFMVGLDRERAKLYELIDARCERMLQAGLLDEVRDLATKGYGPDLKPLQSVGYRQMGLVLRGMLTMAQASEEMKRETRRLAKRQLTWFRGVQGIRWFHPDAGEENIHAAVETFLRP